MLVLAMVLTVFMVFLLRERQTSRYVDAEESAEEALSALNALSYAILDVERTIMATDEIQKWQDCFIESRHKLDLFFHVDIVSSLSMELKKEVDLLSSNWTHLESLHEDLVASLNLLNANVDLNQECCLLHNCQVHANNPDASPENHQLAKTCIRLLTAYENQVKSLVNQMTQTTKNIDETTKAKLRYLQHLTLAAAFILTALVFYLFWRLQGAHHELLQDAVHQKEIEHALETEKENLRTTLASIGEGIIVTDRSGCITRVNAAATQLLGKTEKECLGQLVEIVYRTRHIRTNSPQPSIAKRVFARQEILAPPEPTLLQQTDGNQLPVVETAAPIINPEGKLEGAVLIFRDVSESLQMERQVRQAQKMEAVGRLSSGVAHDFNNILGGIIGLSELIEMQSKHERITNYARQIVSAGERGAELAKKLLTFARRDTKLFKALRIHKVLEESLSLLERTMSRSIVIQKHFFATEDACRGDAGMLQNVFVNLAVNAQDAMPEGGTLTLTTEAVSVSEEETITDMGLIPGEYIRIDFKDTGTGMDDELVKKAFEPFFTTKPEGKGTGLGLAMAYTTIRDHGGVIQLTSELGKGTTFSIYIPLLDENESEVPESPPTPTSMNRRNHITDGVIMIVDDDTTLLGVTSELLESLGYETIPFADPLHAREWYNEHSHQVKGAIVDVIMPGLRGDMLVRHMQNMRPELPVIIVTGFASEESLRNLQELNLVGILRKPFRSESLFNLLNQIDGRQIKPFSS